MSNDEFAAFERRAANRMRLALMVYALSVTLGAVYMATFL